MKAADQMGEGGAEHFANNAGGVGGFPGGFHGGGGGGPTFHFSTGGPGGSTRMSSEDAERIFASFFGHDDPFGRSFGGGNRVGGMPGMSHSIGSGGGDPFQMMFGGGMPGGMHSSFSGMPAGFGMPQQQHQQRRRQQPVTVKRYNAIPAGTIVSFKNLISKADRNGDRGEVQDYDPSSGRYTVLVEDSDELLRVKPENLLQHVHVTLVHIESQQSLNNKKGTVIAWDDSKQRYNIYVMDVSKIVSLKPSNVLLENGTVCKIFGISGKPELNGTYGTIKSYKGNDINRYDVQLSETQIVRLKLENVHV